MIKIKAYVFMLFFIVIGDDLEPGYRSATQESALIISLQMFSLILERCIQLIKEEICNINYGSCTSGDNDKLNSSGNVNNEKDSSSGFDQQQNLNQLVFTADVLVLLPAVKVITIYYYFFNCSVMIFSPIDLPGIPEFIFYR